MSTILLICQWLLSPHNFPWFLKTILRTTPCQSEKQVWSFRRSRELRVLWKIPYNLSLSNLLVSINDKTILLMKCWFPWKIGAFWLTYSDEDPELANFDANKHFQQGTLETSKLSFSWSLRLIWLMVSVARNFPIVAVIRKIKRNPPNQCPILYHNLHDQQQQ